MSGKDDTQYCYIKADQDHQDLADIFKGEYIKNRKAWRFDKNQKEEVTRFLYCSSSESEEGLEDKFARSDSESEDDQQQDGQIKDDMKEVLAMKRRNRNRLHRANSFNASDASDEDYDSIDGSYRRARPSRKKISADVNKLKKEIEKIEVEEGKHRK